MRCSEQAPTMATTPVDNFWNFLSSLIIAVHDWFVQFVNSKVIILLPLLPALLLEHLLRFHHHITNHSSLPSSFRSFGNLFCTWSLQSPSPVCFSSSGLPVHYKYLSLSPCYRVHLPTNTSSSKFGKSANFWNSLQSLTLLFDMYRICLISVLK